MLSTESTGMHFCKQRTTVLKMKKVPDVVQITERGAVQEVHFIGKKRKSKFEATGSSTDLQHQEYFS